MSTTRTPASVRPRGAGRSAAARAVAAMDRVSHGLTVVAALLVAALIPIGIWDVGSREFGLPFMVGGAQLPALILAALAFLAWPGVEADDGHVTTTILIERLPTRAARWLRLLGHVVACAVVAWLLFASVDRALRSLEAGETTIGVDELPVWPVRMILVIALVVLLLQMAATGLRLLLPSMDHGAPGAPSEAPPVTPSEI